MAYREIANSVLAPGQILTSETVRQIRDNERAVREGAISAAGVRVKPYALQAYRHQFAVPISFRGGTTVQVPYTYRQNLGEGDFRLVQTTRGQYLNPATLTDATSTEWLTDRLAVWVAYVFPDSVEFTGDSIGLTGTPAPQMVIIDSNHSLSRFNSRVAFTVQLLNDPRANSASNAITGQVNCSAYYFRDHIWVPDANREA